MAMVALIFGLFQAQGRPHLLKCARARAGVSHTPGTTPYRRFVLVRLVPGYDARTSSQPADEQAVRIAYPGGVPICFFIHMAIRSPREVGSFAMPMAEKSAGGFLGSGGLAGLGCRRPLLCSPEMY